MPTNENTRMRTTPFPVSRSRRQLNFRVLTNVPAGWITPLLAFPLLREDALTSCSLRLGFELYETVEVLANPVLLNVRAYLIPWLSFERFNGSLDSMNRSYAGEVEPGAGGTVIPWFTGSTVQIGPMGASNNEILYYLGAHAADAATYNAAYHEAYNVMVAHRYINRSPELKASIPVAANKKLFPAMWRHPDLGHIVPDFDQATLDGEVPLTIVNGLSAVKGIGFDVNTRQAATNVSLVQPGGANYSGPGWGIKDFSAAGAAGFEALGVAADPANNALPAIYAELVENQAHLSLSAINTAERARSFAAFRKAYAGYDDEYLKDILMSGVRMPAEAEKQPIQLANVMTQFGQGKRYATDSVDLTASVSSGAATCSLNLRCPPVNSGGVIMVTAELYPEQLWERRADPFLNMIDTTKSGMDQLPEYVRDTLDPEKVDVVPSSYVDVRHTTPSATFGYEPLHAKWQTYPPRVGGKFHRPAVDLPADEDRARIWASETVDPTLSKDFYLVTDLHTKPFVVTDEDPSEVLLRGSAMITGNTVFGLPLIESGDEYDTVMDQADFDRIEKEDLPPADMSELQDEGEVEEDE